MREVKNTRDTTLTLILKSSYGKCKAKYTLEPQQVVQLPIYNGLDKLIDFASKKEMFIYDGEGELDIEYCFKKYDFRKLYAVEIETFLVTQKYIERTHFRQKKKIQDFIEVLNLNAENQKYMLIPPFYELLEQELLYG